jgi:hypothetical protein
MATYGKGTLYLNGKPVRVEDFKVELDSELREPHPSLREYASRLRSKPLPKGNLIVDIEPGGMSAAHWIAIAGEENTRRFFALDPAGRPLNGTYGKLGSITSGAWHNDALDLEAMKETLKKFTAPELGSPFDLNIATIERMGYTIRKGDAVAEYEKPLNIGSDGLYDYQRAMMDKLAQATGVSRDMLNAPRSINTAWSLTRKLYEAEQWRQQRMSQYRHYWHALFMRDFLDSMKPRLSHLIAKIYNPEVDYGNPKTVFAASAVPALRPARKVFDRHPLGGRILAPSIGALPRRDGNRGPANARTERRAGRRGA